MNGIELAVQRAREDGEFSTLLDDMVGSLRGYDAFDMSRLYETSNADFHILVDVLKSWRLQRYRDDVFVDVGHKPQS